jgi:hypothetical protein
MADTLKRYMVSISNGADTAVMPTSTTVKTLLSCIIHNRSATDATFDLTAYASSAAHNLLKNQSLPAKSTFIWNSKITFEANEYLKVDPTNVVSVTVVASYLDQTA